MSRHGAPFFEKDAPLCLLPGRGCSNSVLVPAPWGREPDADGGMYAGLPWNVDASQILTRRELGAVLAGLLFGNDACVLLSTFYG
jgi:hypothetical protein